VTRQLIVNADDFGQSAGVNRGVIEAHENGIVTSASLMVRWPDAADAARYARLRPDLSLGLHADFAEWRYRDGTWTAVYEVVSLDDERAIAEEASQQLERFRTLVGADPTHLDSHQHVHRSGPARAILRELAAALGVPLRHCTEHITYCGGFYGQTSDGSPLHDAISVDGLIRTVSELAPGVTELACHPGVDDDVDSMYARERTLELKALCDSRVRDAIAAAGIELRSFRSFRDQ
jgi:predicted glycoside hydrolase/deacetylase ChbG (UPF0249 family)